MNNHVARPMCQQELQLAVEAIARIDEAGDLPELEEEITIAQAWPISLDSERRHCTGSEGMYIPTLADKAQRILGAPYDACLEAATGVVLKTHRQAAVELITRYAKMLATNQKGCRR